jgi:3',5'-cyclic AMP phosphodiesterase CpdA
MPPTRVLHFSDVHLNIPNPGWRPGDFLSKRLTGWLNWNITKRGRRFADANNRILAIRHLVHERDPDGVVFSGDASAIGFGSEAAAVAKILSGIELPKIAVPGNHDYYTRAGVKAQGFETAFADWQQGERIGKETYPFAVKIGSLWFVGVNSCCANSLFWDAHGIVGTEQLQRLDQLLQRLPDEPKVLVTHYPMCRSDGGCENRWHGLRDRDRLSEIVIRHRIRGWLCGHIHRGFLIKPTSDRPFLMFCGGSATQEGPASVSELMFDQDQTAVTKWQWDTTEKRYIAQTPHIVSV